jgi:ABC-type glycerol-3-phosphate transport system substrate-binding protein
VDGVVKTQKWHPVSYTYERWSEIFAATTIPSGSNGTYGIQYSWGLVVSATRHKEETLKFIEWIVTKKRESGFTSWGRYSSV